MSFRDMAPELFSQSCSFAYRYTTMFTALLPRRMPAIGRDSRKLSVSTQSDGIIES
jgi:hypothetical protein